MIEISKPLSLLEAKLKNLRERISRRYEWAANATDDRKREIILAHVKKNVQDYGGLAAVAVALYRQSCPKYDSKTQKPYTVQFSEVG